MFTNQDPTMSTYEVPQLSDSKRSGYVTTYPKLEEEMFFIDGPYAPRTACGLNKLEAQWNDEKRVAWEGTIPNFEGPSEIKENRVMVLKLAYNTFRHLENETFTRYIVLMNEIVNDGIALSNHEVNTGLVNSLPKKLLSFNQALRNSNQVRDLDLAILFGKFKYEVRLIDIIYEPETKKVMSTSTSASPAIFSNSIIQNFYLRGAAYGNRKRKKGQTSLGPTNKRVKAKVIKAEKL
ncbi:hypothetical protein Tco_0933429 [Tanacetum coccineum]